MGLLGDLYESPVLGGEKIVDFCFQCKGFYTDLVSIQLPVDKDCHCERSEAISRLGGLPVGRASCPSFPNRQAGSLSHHSLLAMTTARAAFRVVGFGRH